eukprot:UN13032
MKIQKSFIQFHEKCSFSISNVLLSVFIILWDEFLRT